MPVLSTTNTSVTTPFRSCLLLTVDVRRLLRELSPVSLRVPPVNDVSVLIYLAGPGQSLITLNVTPPR